MSSSSTSLRGAVDAAAEGATHRVAARRERAAHERAHVERAPRRSRRRRCVRRRGRASAICRISTRARANSSGVIAAKSRVRSSSSALHAPTSSSPPSISGPGPGAPPFRRCAGAAAASSSRSRRPVPGRGGTTRRTRGRTCRGPRAARRASAAASSRRRPDAPGRPSRARAARRTTRRGPTSRPPSRSTRPKTTTWRTTACGALSHGRCRRALRARRRESRAGPRGT